jgi:hypothetical protein
MSSSPKDSANAPVAAGKFLLILKLFRICGFFSGFGNIVEHRKIQIIIPQLGITLVWVSTENNKNN